MHRKVILPALADASVGLALLGPAAAGTAGGAHEALMKAVSDFQALVKEDSAKGSPPLLSDPKAKPVLEALLDRGKILGAHPYDSGELDTLLGIFNTLLQQRIDQGEASGIIEFVVHGVTPGIEMRLDDHVHGRGR